MNDKAKAHFKELNDQEKLSKLAFATSQKIKIVVWEKGKNNKVEVEGDIFLKEKLQIVLSDNNSLENQVKDLLYSFSINGVSFFGKCKLINPDRKLVLDCTNQLFKSERRKNYRLLTYPHFKSFAEADLDVSEIEDSNVVNLATKKTTTGLFKNFLELVNEEEGSKTHQGISFRVFDLSVTGVALLFGELEKEVLDKNEFIQDLKIKLSDHSVLIPRAKVCYITDMIGSKNYTYKAGIEFVNIDTNLDSQLGFIINKFLRDTDSEFEDFLE